MSKVVQWGLPTATALVVGNMIGSGIFMLPASLAVYGKWSFVGWLVTAAGAMTMAWVFSQLSLWKPAIGGPYAYAHMAFGDGIGFLVAWGYWVSIWTGNAAITTSLIAYLGGLFPQVTATPLRAASFGLLFIWTLTWINARSYRAGGWVQVVTTILKTLPLVFLTLIALFVGDFQNVVAEPSEPVAPLNAIHLSVALALWAMLGLESATIPAQTIKDPNRTIPRATLIGAGSVALLYILACAGVFMVLGAETLQHSTAPFADAAQAIGGSKMRVVIGLAAVISCLGALNGWVLLQAQIPYAMAKENLLPQIFAKTNAAGIPIWGLLLSSGLASALILANYTRGLQGLFNFSILVSTTACLIPYLFSALALWFVPGPGKSTKALIGSIAFGYSLYAIAGAGQEAVYWGFLLLLSGIPILALIRIRHQKGKLK
ncbi:MAG: amino acid permease [Acidobacteria bacterium]|nr:amino acid permease [Acidobacteriota bacterium]MCB9397456.1 amino acid permease [Acidobacteriota bacterium]